MSSSCCCIDVDDRPEVYSATIRHARIPHVCGECGETINPGEEYEDYRGCYEGTWGKHKTCWFCLCIRRDFFPCGWYYGNLREDFEDCHGWDYVTMEEQ